MSVLSKEEIIKALKKGRVKIEPLDIGNIGPASIDLTLGEDFRVFKKAKGKLDIREDTDYVTLTKPVKGPITLKHGEFILGITEEKITLPEDICGHLSGRSRFARLGIIVHATASFIQPGIDNKQVLEIYNLSKRTLVLHPGTRICQLSLNGMKGKSKYNGKFRDQLTV
ncbi:MAG: dCTP deaminase [Nanoarchaeota archaeon]